MLLWPKPALQAWAFLCESIWLNLFKINYRMFKTILRRIAYTLLTCLVILALWGLFAISLPHIRVNRGFTETPGGVTIYVCSNGVHTDVAFPANSQYIDWRKEFIPSTFKAVDSTFQYIQVGWGNKRFYLNTPTWSDLTVSTALRALFLRDSSVMHVTYNRFPPKVSPQYCHKIVISAEQYKQLIAYVQRYLNTPSGRAILIPAKGYDVDDNFYQANGHYSFVKTCNVWTCGALKAAGVEQGLWTPFQSGVMNGYLK
jgi:uncharacterized protein (TIGR02117 family)